MVSIFAPSHGRFLNLRFSEDSRLSRGLTHMWWRPVYVYVCQGLRSRPRGHSGCNFHMAISIIASSRIGRAPQQGRSRFMAHDIF